MSASHCANTCRNVRPDRPETWCDGCHQDEAEDREDNLLRWRESECARKIREFMQAEETRRESDPRA